jgi:hypothetical protein
MLIVEFETTRTERIPIVYYIEIEDGNNINLIPVCTGRITIWREMHQMELEFG